MKSKNLIRSGFVVYGLLMASGIVVVFVPQSVMLRIGTLCQLPSFEITPVFEYMARGLSLSAFLFGLLMLYFAFHLSEEARLINLVGWAALSLIPVVIWIHAIIPTPWWWKAGDITGLAILWILCIISHYSNNSEFALKGTS